jgi:hypothetical protein
MAYACAPVLRFPIVDAANSNNSVLDFYPSNVTAISVAAPTSWKSKRLSAATSAGTAITATGFTTVTDMIIINRDSTNFVTLTCTEIGTDAITVKIRAGKACWIPGIDPTATTKLVADTSACLCDVFYLGT